MKSIFSVIDKNPRVIMLLALTGILLYFYSPIILHPLTYILNDNGDSIKNYFCYEWHVQNDNSFIDYTGTNYPFGEHHSFTDGTPILANFVKALPFFKPYSIAIFNWSLFASFILCALILFSIFKKFEVANGFAIIASIGITLLNPQSFRMLGHYALSYSFFIPLVIYLLLLFEMNGQKKIHGFLITLTLICCFFTHQYLGMIITSFVFAYHVIKIVFSFRTIKNLLLPFFFQAIFPVLFYLLFLKITDTHTDRISHPYGFLFFTANVESVFVSTLPPFKNLVSHFIKINSQNWEGVAYVGLATLLTIVYLPYLIFTKRNRLSQFFTENKNAFTMLLMVFASIFILLFSMGYPFKWKGEWILDVVPLIKQFRAPGRFAWVFYFVATISCTVVLSKYFLRQLNSNYRNVIVALLLILYSVEGFAYHKDISEKVIVKNCFDFESLNPEMVEICLAIKKEKVQAIIPLPFFHIGTDYFCLTASEKIKSASFIAAFNTNTPIAGSYTPRTSLQESKMLMQLVSNGLIKRDIEAFTKSNQPFYILFSKEGLTEEEQAVYEKGKTVIETFSYVLKRVMPAELFSNNIEKYKNEYKVNSNLLGNAQGMHVPKGGLIKFLDFDSLPRHSLTAAIKNEVVLYDIPANTIEKDKDYEASFWYYLKGGDELCEDFLIKEISTSGEVMQVLADKGCNRMPNVYGNKILVTLNFKTTNPQNIIRVCMKGNKDYKDFFTLDDLLIRRKDVDIYKVKHLSAKDSVLTLNNFELR